MIRLGYSLQMRQNVGGSAAEATSISIASDRNFKVEDAGDVSLLNETAVRLKGRPLDVLCGIRLDEATQHAFCGPGCDAPQAPSVL